MLAAGIDQHRRGAASVGIFALGSRHRRIEPPNLAAYDLDIAMRLHGVGKRPQHRVHGIGIDIGIDRDEDFPERRIERSRGAKRLPGLAWRRSVVLNDEHHVAARHLVARDLLHGRNVAGTAQVLQIDRIERRLANDCAFARREFADDALIDRPRELAGGSIIMLPSSEKDFANPTTAADIERYIASPGFTSKERVAILKLVWDFIGTEFAGRHEQYERFN